MTLTPRRLVPAQTRERRLRWLLCERVRRGNLKPRKHFRFLWRLLSNLEGKGDAYLPEAWGRGEAVQRCCPLGSALPQPLAGVQGVLRSCETVFLAASAKHGGMLAKHVKKQRSLGCRVSKLKQGRSAWKPCFWHPHTGATRGHGSWTCIRTRAVPPVGRAALNPPCALEKLPYPL